MHIYNLTDKVETFRQSYAEWGAVIILLKGLTPIPYKLVTITSGFAGYNIWLFILCSIVARGGRFFVLAVLLNRYGDFIRAELEKRLDDLGRDRRHRACRRILYRLSIGVAPAAPGLPGGPLPAVEMHWRMHDGSIIVADFAPPPRRRSVAMLFAATAWAQSAPPPALGVQSPPQQSAPHRRRAATPAAAAAA